MPKSDIDLAIAIAHEAGELLRTLFGRVQMELKADKNVVTEADHAAEALIAKRLAEARPDDGLVADG